ncbi:TonB-dependent receptor [Pedobacter antarcticus]|uniref:TonB-dependent receptor n=1 Tax=Pedobacter antarcticus TaxID=34086 RepID=UPI00292F8E4E|nr:TonB-dependent receptor [Pedobacter antarcticus]
MKKYLMMLFLAWYGTALSFGQVTGAKIKGMLLDHQGVGIDGATMSVKKQSDSSLVKMEFSEANGSFIFNGIAPGVYLLDVNLMGQRVYQSVSLNITAGLPVLDLGTIRIQEQQQSLKEVSIVSKKALIEHQIDRTVLNVDALISNAGTTAMDVLEKSPGVRVDQNGLVSLKGQQGVTIFIDDKPTYLSGADLEGYLRSLPATTLDKIEIMSNPPAKYDAAGKGGVINIKTKKQKLKGFNLGINASAGQGIYTTTNNSIDFNYKNNKINVFGNAGYSFRNGASDLHIYRNYRDEVGNHTGSFDQQTFLRRKGWGINGLLGADYSPSELTSWGVVFTGFLRKPNSNNLSENVINDAAGKLESLVKARNLENGSSDNFGTNLNYRHLFKKDGPDISADLDYLRYGSGNKQDYVNDIYNSDRQFDHVEGLNGNLNGNINILSAKVDYTHPFSGKLKLAGGLKNSFTETDNVADYSNTMGGVTTPDYDKSNQFKYKERISAAYVNLNKDFDRWSVQAGLRLENTDSRGRQLGNIMKSDSSFKRNYTGLFPTLFVRYQLDTSGNQQLKFNYGRRVERPYYQDLNPFISPLDKFTYYVGNPYLLPSFSQKVEVTYVWKKLSTSVSYSSAKDEFNETIEIKDGIYYSRPGNIGSSKVLSWNIDAGVDPFSWLNLQFYGELTRIHSKSDFYSGLLDNKGVFTYLQGIAQFKLKHGWNAQLDGNYQSKVTNAQFVVGEQWRMNMGLSKTLSPKTTLKLSVSDIFRTQVTRGTINNLNLTDAGWVNRGDSRRAVLTLSMRLGQMKANRPDKRSGADSEADRVKQ